MIKWRQKRIPTFELKKCRIWSDTTNLMQHQIQKYSSFLTIRSFKYGPENGIRHLILAKKIYLTPMTQLKCHTANLFQTIHIFQKERYFINISLIEFLNTTLMKYTEDLKFTCADMGIQSLTKHLKKILKLAKVWKHRQRHIYEIVH